MNDEPSDLEPDWEHHTPPDAEYRRIGQAIRKIDEIDGVSVTTSAEVELKSSDLTEATITIVTTDAVVDDDE